MLSPSAALGGYTDLVQLSDRGAVIAAGGLQWWQVAVPDGVLPTRITIVTHDVVIVVFTCHR